MLKVLFIIDPIKLLKPHKDSSVAMMEAFSLQGCSIFVSEYQDWSAVDQSIQVHAQEVQVQTPVAKHLSDWYTLSPKTLSQATDFDVVIVRKDPPFNLEYIYLTHLLDRVEALGVKVLNKGAALRDHPEKLSILEFPQFTPPTIVSANYAACKSFHEQYKDIVVKPLDGMGGTGIFRIVEHDSNRSSILETLTQQQTIQIMAQEYRPEIKQGDKRILIINGQVVPYCLARIPQEGELRGNLAVGGQGVAQRVSSDNQVIAESIGRILAPRGLFLIGLDMIGNYITEINVTSPTCFVEIFEQTGYNVASFFVNEVISLIKAHQCSV